MTCSIYCGQVDATTGDPLTIVIRSTALTTRIHLRRGISLALPLVLAVTLTACGSDEPEAAATETSMAGAAATMGPMATATNELAATAEATAEHAGIEISDAWARATAGLESENSAVYMLITNHGDDDRLVAASASPDLAARVELHETVRDGDAMRMQQVDGWDIAAGGTLELKQGGNHVMLLEIAEQFVPGMTVEVTLEFEQAGEISVSAPVREGDSMGTPSAMN